MFIPKRTVEKKQFARDFDSNAAGVYTISIGRQQKEPTIDIFQELSVSFIFKWLFGICFRQIVERPMAKLYIVCLTDDNNNK